MSIYDWSITAAENATAAADINWRENQDPDTAKSSACKVMAQRTQWSDDVVTKLKATFCNA